VPLWRWQFWGRRNRWIEIKYIPKWTWRWNQEKNVRSEGRKKGYFKRGCKVLHLLTVCRKVALRRGRLVEVKCWRCALRMKQRHQRLLLIVRGADTESCRPEGTLKNCLFFIITIYRQDTCWGWFMWSWFMAVDTFSECAPCIGVDS